MKRKADFPNLDTIEFVSVIYDDEININNLKKNTNASISSKNKNSIQSHCCTSCGASLRKNEVKCEYCGTEYW